MYTVTLGKLSSAYVGIVGAYATLEEATKKCKSGYKVYDANNKVVLDKSIHPWVTVGMMYDVKMREEIKAGIKWYYSNSACKRTWKSAHDNKTYKTNCAQGICWILRSQGILEAGSRFYGNNGKIQWIGDAEKLVKAKCSVINLKGKTISAAIKDGSIQAGDIVMYMDMVHTNMYMGNNKWFDCGHAYCAPGQTGEGAKFSAWTGKTVYSNARISYVIRLKQTAVKPAPITTSTVAKSTTTTTTVKPTTKKLYKVQLGAFSVKANADALSKKATKKGFDCFIDFKNNQYYVISGAYENKTNATNRVAAIKKAGFNAIII